MESYKAQNTIARFSAGYHFVLEGGLIGIWACYLPSIQDRLDLDDSSLGLSVLLMYLGTVLGTYAASVLLRQFGSQRATLVGAVTFGAFLPLIALSPSFAILCMTMFLFGLAMAVMDVSMNGIAVLTEMVAEKPLLNSMHACYSLSAGISSIIAGLFSSMGWTALPVYIGAAVIATVCTIIASFGSYHFADEILITSIHSRLHHAETAYAPLNKEEGDQETEIVPQSTFSLLSNSTFLYFASIGFLASFGETGMTTWLVIYFVRFFDGSTLAASIGFGLFMLFMAIGRFSGDKMREIYGRRILFHACGLFIIVGFALLLSSPSFKFANNGAIYVGYFSSCLMGAGLSILIPTVFSSAGHLPGIHAGSAIACAAALTYAGGVVSPLFLGGFSQLFHSLKDAFIMDAVLMGGIFLISFKIPGEVSMWFGAKSDCLLEHADN